MTGNNRHMNGSALLFGVALVVVIAGGCGESAPEPPDGMQTLSPLASSLLRSGTLALQEHDFERALALVDSVESLKPGLADVRFLKGRIHSELAQLDMADSLYREVIAIRPAYPGVWHNLGNTAFRQQRYSDAIEHYRHEFDLHGEAQPWRGIGRAFVELGQTDSARAAFEQAVAIDTSFAQAHFSLALLLEDLGDMEGAYAAASRARAIDPADPEYRYYSALYLLRLGKPDEAIGPLQEVIEDWPWHHGAHYNSAQALMRLGRTDEARYFQDRAEVLRDLQAQISRHEGTVRVAPNDPHAHAGLGTLLRQAGRYNDAMHAYRVALYLDPNNLDYRNNMAVVHLLRQDTTAAIQTFEQILKADSTRVHSWINLGSLYAMSGMVDEASNAWRTALRLEPGNEIASSSIESLDGRSR